MRRNVQSSHFSWLVWKVIPSDIIQFIEMRRLKLISRTDNVLLTSIIQAKVLIAALWRKILSCVHITPRKFIRNEWWFIAKHIVSTNTSLPVFSPLVRAGMRLTRKSKKWRSPSWCLSGLQRAEPWEAEIKRARRGRCSYFSLKDLNFIFFPLSCTNHPAIPPTLPKNIIQLELS